MPIISKVRLTNVIYENGAKRYNDQCFTFDGENGIFLLENGGGKTVFLQTVLQAILPHTDMADRKIKETLVLDSSPAHIAIEWLLNDKPRQYLLTAVSLYLENNQLKSYKYVYAYGPTDKQGIDYLPFVVEGGKGLTRAASKGEISDYYSKMKSQSLTANYFTTAKDYHAYLDKNYQIIASEWGKIRDINGSEGGIKQFFENCTTTQQLVNHLLIPTVEDALASQETVSFAQTFEKQREHFKQNKRLLEEIDQFKAIKEQVDQYVSDYHRLYLAQEAYRQRQGEWVNFNRYVQKTLSQHQAEREQWLQENENFEKWQQTYTHQQMSYNIVKLERLIAAEEDKRDQANSIKKDYEKVLENIKQTIQNIELTELKSDEVAIRQEIEALRVKIDLIDKNTDAQGLQERLEEVLSNVHGCFNYQIEGLEKEMIIIDGQKERQVDHIQNLHKQLEDKQLAIEDLQKISGQLGAIINESENRMQAIEAEVLTAFKREEADKHLKLLFSQNTQITQQINQDIERSHQIEVERGQCDVDKDQILADLAKAQTALSERMSLLEDIDKKQDRLIEQLEGQFSHLGYVDSLYVKESLIRESIGDQIHKLNDRYESALKEERVASRLIDLYDQAEYYTVDPLLIDELTRKSHYFSYWTLGSRYISDQCQTLDLSLERAYAIYPYWANTIITTEQDRPEMLKFIEAFKNQLSYPIILMTTLEIQRLLKEEEIQDRDNIIFPNPWLSNLDKSSFEEWKGEQTHTYQEKMLYRKQVNRSKEAVLLLESQFTEFISRYPYETFLDLKKQIDTLNSDIRNLEEKRQVVESDKSLLATEKKKVEQRLNTSYEERQSLEHQLTLVKTFIQQLKNQKSALQDKKMNEDHLKDLREALSRLQINIEQENDLLDTLKESYQQCHYRLQTLKASPHLAQAKHVKASMKYCEEPVEGFVLQAADLQDQLKGIQSDLSTLNHLLSQTNERLDKCVNKRRLKEEGAEYPILYMESIAYFDMKALVAKREKAKGDYQAAEKDWRHLRDEVVRIQERRQVKWHELEDHFDCLYTFEMPYEEIDAYLDQEKQRIKEKADNLKQFEKQNDKLLRLFEKTKTEIDKLAIKHQFESLKTSLKYNESEYIDFIYESEPFFNQRVKALEQDAVLYTQEKERMSRHLESYLKFCRTFILKPQLRETAISGIEKKQDYQDLLAFKETMGTMLTRNIKVAEDDRRESDKELQTFIAHLLAYTQTILHEINHIQTKTKIRVGDTSKQIFTFIVPEIDELEAKEELRRYINHLVEDYDTLKADPQTSDDEQSQVEDREKVRQYLEKKLSVNQLIIRVMGHNRIKIKCRKVTSDLKISSTPMTWESSNKWSDGEKWSKNMTLFLSILNYLAEKKHYPNQRIKRQRTVILDNPFGQASSKHVLDPVFFIADNLGFQMIAVTAHAEGEYVTDYFPVVYSGRLRTSNDPDKKIMTVKKTINTAYFKVATPESLVRFEESEQLRFF